MADAVPGDRAASCAGGTSIKSSLSYLAPDSEATSETFCKENASYCNCATSSTRDP